MLTDEQVKEYQRLYLLKFNEEISTERAIEEGESLVHLVKQIYKPISININKNGKRE